MKSKEKLISLCNEFLDNKNLADDKHKAILKEELREIDVQDQHDYFLSLYDKKAKFPNNENNLLVPYLLGLVNEFNSSLPPKFDYGEYPDIDIDYLPAIRSYLKDDFSRKQFGEDRVCNICTYTTFSLRNVIIDMARVLGLDRSEVLNITTNLGDKDDEGEILTWDKAIELYDDLREYLDRNPDLKAAASRLLYRNRNISQHASGLIISGKPIADFVPLVVPRGSSVPASAWVEGLHGTDLGAVGLVKFDFLSLDANLKNALAVHRIIEGEEANEANISVKLATNLIDGKICALPGQRSWSDLSYLNDPDALRMANQGDLKMIFQYDASEGVRKLVVEGGVTRFDDLAAYVSLYRPGPIKCKMHEAYCRRKRGKEKFEIHPLLQDFMETTYGVLVYQEQCLKMLNVVGKIPLKDCEIIRKAISKKKVDKFLKYKEMFIENGQEILGWPKDKVESLWDQIEAFAGYAFNMSHAVAYTYISSRMLYLKAHYPIEFYSSVLTCKNASGPKDYARLKEYKQEAEKHNVKVERLDLNKSSDKCEIIDGKIYWGFAKIKGIGDEVARRIVSHQPYNGFVDFLTRYGTDAKVIGPLIALGLFHERDKVTLYKYYQDYKKWERRNATRHDRYREQMAKCDKEKIELKLAAEAGTITQDEYWESMERLNKKVTRAQANHERKNRVSDMPSLLDFCPPEGDIEEGLAKAFENPEQAEVDYYGFVWQHPLEKCPGYQHNTIEKYFNEGLQIGPLEVMVEKVNERQGKSVKYYQLIASDASGANANITMWKDDYPKVRHLLHEKALVKVMVKAPTPPFRNFTMVSPPKRHYNDSELPVFNLLKATPPVH